MNFNINISGIDVTQYVIEENFDGVTLEAESDVLHSFWADVINIKFYFHIKEVLRTIENEPVVVSWYGKNIFRGYVSDIQYDEYSEESIDIEIVSIGYLINNFVLENNLKTYNQEEGDSISFIVSRVQQTAERALMSGGYRNYSLTANIKDDIDFIELQTAILNDSIQNTPKSKMIVRKVTPTFYGGGSFKSFIQGDDIFLLDALDGGETTSVTISKVEIDNGISIVDTVEETFNQIRYSEDYVFFEQESLPRYVIIQETENEMIDYFKEFLSVSSYWSASDEVDSTEIEIKSSAKINEQYYLLEGIRKSKYFTFLIELSQKDNFRYNYEKGSKLGQILKDFAIVSDSILWISSENTINIIDRVSPENNPVINVFDILDYEEKILSYSDKKIDLPSEIELINTGAFPVRENIINHYSEVMSGKKIQTKLEILVNQDSDYINIGILKNQQIDGLVGDCGIVKKIHFKDETLEITAEKRYIGMPVL